MKNLFCVFLLAAIALPAADLTGKWTGAAKGLEDEENSAVLHLKQNGAEITGTAGPSDEQQWPIRNGKIEGDKITFQLPTDGPTVRFELSLVEDHMKGKATFDLDGNPKTVTLDLTRKE